MMLRLNKSLFEHLDNERMLVEAVERLPIDEGVNHMLIHEKLREEAFKTCVCGHVKNDHAMGGGHCKICDCEAFKPSDNNE